MRLSPTMTGETRIATAPVKSLRHPPFAPAESQLVIRHRFWVSDRTLTATFDALKKLAPHGTRTQGEGESGDHGRVTERDIEFAVVHLPGTLADADLDIQVVRDGHGHSAVGAYAEVVPQPKRRPNEHVPLSVRTVKLLRLKDFPSRVVKSRTINGRRAATLVRDFDALVVRPPGEMSCPAGTHETEAVFRSHGHTWRASYPSCDACPSPAAATSCPIWCPTAHSPGRCIATSVECDALSLPTRVVRDGSSHSTGRVSGGTGPKCPAAPGRDAAAPSPAPSRSAPVSSGG